MEKRDIHIRLDAELVEEFDEKCREIGIEDRTTCIVEAMKALIGRSQVIQYLDKRIAQKMKQYTIYDIIKKALESEAKELSMQEVAKEYHQKALDIMKRLENTLLRYESMLSNIKDLASIDESYKPVMEILKDLVNELHNIRTELQKLDQEIHAVHIALARKASSSRRRRRKRYEEEEIAEWSGGSKYG